ncbi:TetR family transcriptional regulator [Mycolicibacterium sp.]|uniref:TetR/AcrR family transcriptional regulator n=1 Tax=Mycolicibacterium sp. TaxID=2320850 RepID=UPI001D99FA32|nr:TetR family transcriptional regulator [Mycolicibacterium sp.]MCB1292174.1 TetR/AcrR family transcriptional regulator [Mycobacterium sp.]MCB9408426.1 TetR/AcrR family transcriptional regulator [Mycolicibacterium sp.]
MSTEPDKPRRGRPSLEAERRAQIVNAFIGLIADKGLEHTSLGDVAEASGLHRSALRHFVGNREDLINAAIEEVTRAALADMQVELSLNDVIAMLFDPARMASLGELDRAWYVLMSEAMRSREGRAVLKACYDQLMTIIGDALRHRYPNAKRAKVADTAYAIACLAEYNYVFQSLGYPRARIRGLRDAALALAAQLD